MAESQEVEMARRSAILAPLFSFFAPRTRFASRAIKTMHARTGLKKPRWPSAVLNRTSESCRTVGHPHTDHVRVIRSGLALVDVRLRLHGPVPIRETVATLSRSPGLVAVRVAVGFPACAYSLLAATVPVLYRTLQLAGPSDFMLMS